MEKQIATIMLGICLISLASSMYAGESMSIETDLTEPIYYTVVGNSSDLEGLNVSFENGNITISTVLNFKPDNFTLIFFDEKTKEVEKIVYRGGGGSTKYVDKIITQNQTVYVPEYINNTEIIEVEKIVDNTTILEKGYELWHVLFAIVIGGIFIWYVMRYKKEDENKSEETN